MLSSCITGVVRASGKSTLVHERAVPLDLIETHAANGTRHVGLFKDRERGENITIDDEGWGGGGGGWILI
jgi:hypothetical protein